MPQRGWWVSGGVLGGVLPNMQSISDKLAGKHTLHIDPETITLLAARALDLLNALQKRGHAAQAAARAAAWAVADASVLSISADGLITPAKVGTTTVTATVGGAVLTITVRIK